jgi:hypothetical protein
MFLITIFISLSTLIAQENTTSIFCDYTRDLSDSATSTTGFEIKNEMTLVGIFHGNTSDYFVHEIDFDIIGYVDRYLEKHSTDISQGHFFAVRRDDHDEGTIVQATQGEIWAHQVSSAESVPWTFILDSTNNPPTPTQQFTLGRLSCRTSL